MVRFHRAPLWPLLSLLSAACHPLHFADERELTRVNDEELCGRRSNVLNGWLMHGELVRRGVDCAPYDEAALRRGFHLSFLTGQPVPASVAGGVAEASIAIGQAPDAPPASQHADPPLLP